MVSLQADGPQGGTSARLGSQALAVRVHVRPGCSCTLRLPSSHTPPQTPGSAEFSLVAALHRAAGGRPGAPQWGGCSSAVLWPLSTAQSRKGSWRPCACEHMGRLGEVAPVPVLGHAGGGSRPSPAGSQRRLPCPSQDEHAAPSSGSQKRKLADPDWDTQRKSDKRRAQGTSGDVSCPARQRGADVRAPLEEDLCPRNKDLSKRPATRYCAGALPSRFPPARGQRHLPAAQTRPPPPGSSTEGFGLGRQESAGLQTP